MAGTWWERVRASLRFDTLPPEDISQNPSKSLIAALGGLMTTSGIEVTPRAVLNLPDVEACHRVIAQAVGRCPLKVRVRDERGNWLDAEDDPLWEILHDLPNPEQTASAFRSQLTRDLLAHERAFAEIIRRPNGSVVAMWRLDPERMHVDRDAQNRKRYTYRLADGTSKEWIFDPDKPPILDLEYPSPVRRCRELFGLALAMEQYCGMFFTNGARLSGILSTDAPKIDDNVLKDLQAKFSALNTGLRNAHKVAVGTNGLKFHPIAAANDEAQLLELQKLIRSRIAGVHGVPPHKIGDLDHATFSNIEHLDREFVAQSCDPIFVLFEQSLRRDVLTTRQYPRKRTVFDREALIQSDFKSRIEALGIAREKGVYSANDVRRRLDENPIPADQGGDLYHMNGNMVPLTGRTVLGVGVGPAALPPPAPSPQLSEQVM